MWYVVGLAVAFLAGIAFKTLMDRLEGPHDPA